MFENCLGGGCWGAGGGIRNKDVGFLMPRVVVGKQLKKVKKGERTDLKGKTRLL